MAMANQGLPSTSEIGPSRTSTTVPSGISARTPPSKLGAARSRTLSPLALATMAVPPMSRSAFASAATGASVARQRSATSARTGPRRARWGIEDNLFPPRTFHSAEQPLSRPAGVGLWKPVRPPCCRASAATRSLAAPGDGHLRRFSTCRPQSRHSTPTTSDAQQPDRSIVIGSSRSRARLVVVRKLFIHRLRYVGCAFSAKAATRT